MLLHRRGIHCRPVSATYCEEKNLMDIHLMYPVTIIANINTKLLIIIIFLHFLLIYIIILQI